MYLYRPTEEQRENLFALAEYLDQLDPDCFDMDYWVRPGPYLHLTERPRPSCGTVGCAMAWAAAIFPELRIETIGAEPYFVLNRLHFQSGFEPARELFGLTCGESHYLFGAVDRGNPHRPNYPSPVLPAHVADRIYRFVRTGRIEPVLVAALPYQ